MSSIPPRAMIPADLFRLQFVDDPQISPDGTRVAFVCTRLDEERDEYLANVFVMAASGGEPRRFTTGPKRDAKPRWSPDGKRLAFISEREDKPAQLYVMPADGGEPRPLTDLKSAVEEPVWSPDGAYIAFTSRPVPDVPEDGKDKSKPARVITSLRYKANGEGLIADRRRQLFAVPSDGGAVTRVTDGDYDHATPSWSPDGTRLTFAAARHPERDYDEVVDIWVLPFPPAENAEPRRLTPGRGPSRHPAWSPDGSEIAYTGNEYALDMGRNNRVYIVPAAGVEPRCLTAELDRTCTPFSGELGPRWSSDARFIYFGIEDRGSVPVYRVAADGASAPEPVVEGERQITGLSLARDGTLAFTATDPINPAEVFLGGTATLDPCTDQPAERRLTDLNRALKDELELVAPRRFQYERDGFALDGWMMPPARREPGRRYPTLLNVHGGPATQYGYAFFDEFQVYAGAGYAVVFTNPRGSQGYGEAFTRAVRGDWGGGDFQDVMLGLDEALKRFDFIDSDHVGVLGGSYGGFMTSWIVGHDDRFKAACSERAVNNAYTLFGTSDIGSHFSETHAGALPWENMQWFIDHSPLTYAQHINTPLLILHSEDDLRCPIEQAEQLFTMLKKLRKEVLFVRFPDESHELSRSGRPRHRRERFDHILDWFARYLA